MFNKTVHLLLALVLVVTMVDWYALRSGVVTHSPRMLAVLFGAVIVLLILGAVGAAARVRSHGPRALPRLFIFLGLLTVIGAGMYNWARSLQGYVIVPERQAVPLGHGSHLHDFVAGPLSNVVEMNVVLMLAEVELEATEYGIRPASRLEIMNGDDSRQAVLRPGEPVTSGSLRFFQGNFGFAPRIVITHDGETVFDQVVPWTTERHFDGRISFAGHFTVAQENLDVRGEVDLSSLDEKARGHATLRLAVRSEGRLLGEGSLLPGHFAELANGYAIGFAGLDKWSEIDIARRDTSEVMMTGGGVMLVGILLWIFAGFRRRAGCACRTRAEGAGGGGRHSLPYDEVPIPGA